MGTYAWRQYAVQRWGEEGRKRTEGKGKEEKEGKDGQDDLVEAVQDRVSRRHRRHLSAVTPVVFAQVLVQDLSDDSHESRSGREEETRGRRRRGSVPRRRT